MEGSSHGERPANTGNIYDILAIQAPSDLQTEITAPGQLVPMEAADADLQGRVAEHREFTESITDLPLAEQEETLYGKALEAVGSDPSAQSIIARLFPPEHPALEQAYTHAITSSLDGHDRAETLIELSRREDVDPHIRESAFRQAVRSAIAIGEVDAADEKVHMLELFAAGETDFDNLNTIVSQCAHISNRKLHPGILSTAAGQYLSAGAASDIARIDRYNRVIGVLERYGIIPELDIARLHKIDYLLKRDGAAETRLAIWRDIRRLYPEYKPLGHITIAEQSPPEFQEGDWQTVRNGIEEHWDSYSKRFRTTIVNRLLNAGNFEDAAQCALSLIERDTAEPGLLQASRTTIATVVNRQAKIDPDGAFNTIHVARMHAAHGLDELIAARTGLAGSGDDSAKNDALQHARADDLNHAATLRVALLAVTDPERALVEANQYMPYGTTPQQHLAQFYSGVSKAFAEKGDITNAARYAELVSAEPYAQNLRALSFATVAHAVRTQRFAENQPR